MLFYMSLIKYNIISFLTNVCIIAEKNGHQATGDKVKLSENKHYYTIFVTVKATSKNMCTENNKNYMGY